MAPEATCPSAAAVEGAQILGVIQADGSVVYLKGEHTATQEFLAAAHSIGVPKQRFRTGRTQRPGTTELLGPGDHTLKSGATQPQAREAVDDIKDADAIEHAIDWLFG